MMRYNRIFTLLAVLCLVVVTYAEYSKVEWKFCGPRNVEIDENDIQPMPIIYKRNARWKLSAFLYNDITSRVPTNVTIIRSISGIQLPIRCYVMSGTNVGSCNFPDLCSLLMSLLDFKPTNCPQTFVNEGVDCRCPFNIAKGPFNIDEMIPFSGPNFEIAPWFLAGDYYLKAKSADDNGPLFCLEMSFTIKGA